MKSGAIIKINRILHGSFAKTLLPHQDGSGSFLQRRRQNLGSGGGTLINQNHHRSSGKSVVAFGRLGRKGRSPPVRVFLNHDRSVHQKLGGQVDRTGKISPGGIEALKEGGGPRWSASPTPVPAVPRILLTASVTERPAVEEPSISRILSPARIPCASAGEPLRGATMISWSLRIPHSPPTPA